MANQIPAILTNYQEGLKRHWLAAVTAITETLALQPNANRLALIFNVYAAVPGKFVRPSLFLASYYEGQKGYDEDIYDLAISLELIHLYLLIQDDIMDASHLRRGQKTLHLQLADYHRQRKLNGNPDSFGVNTALLMSDLCSNYAESIWTAKVADGTVVPELRKYLDELKKTVFYGQFLDLLAPTATGRVSKSDILQVMLNKTAKYSIYQPMLMGTLAATKGPESADWLEAFAYNLGIAFQIIDDILGTFGDPSTTGKSILSDIEERKQTLLVHFASSASSTAKARALKDFYAYKGSVTPAEVKEIFIQTGAAEKSTELARRYLAKSLAALKQADINHVYRDQLQELSEFVVARKF